MRAACSWIAATARISTWDGDINKLTIEQMEQMKTQLAEIAWIDAMG